MSTIDNTKSGNPMTIHPFIGTLFPKENYKTAGGNMALHYLIALKQPFNSIQEWINKMKDPQKRINYSEGKYFGLTPLAVCTLVRDKETATLLIQKGADPTIADLKKWTPFHHAIVMQDQEMVELLKRAKHIDAFTIQKLLNYDKGNYEHLEKLLNVKISKPEENVFHYFKEKEGIVIGTAAEFKELTGAEYCSSVIISPTELIKYWGSPDASIQIYLEKFRLEQYEQCSKTPP